MDLLRVRVRELRGVVDRFVLLEAGSTFQGAQRQLLFEEAHAAVEDLLGEQGGGGGSSSSSSSCGSRFDTVQVPSFPSHEFQSFVAENYLRDSIYLSGALDEAQGSDVVVLIR